MTINTSTPAVEDETDTEALLSRVEEALAVHRDELIELSHALHDDPETGGQEVRAHRRITELLARSGFELAATPDGLPTAFAARAGSSPLTAAICVEYDALPEIGHGCGHNVNATSALGAALALRPMLDALGLSLLVLGTPAEETHGAKVDLIELGYFDDVAFAMMAHAATEDTVGNPSLALTCWDITFTGKPAHAAASPEAGNNALNAMLIAQTAIALERQQLPPDSVVSTNLTEGGTAVNVIPERSRGVIEMRSPSFEQLQTVKARVRRCLEAGAHATGCELAVGTAGNDFADLRQDVELGSLYRAAMARRGRTVIGSKNLGGSTDMGNVSLRVPTIHPMLDIEAPGISLHTAEFAAAAVSAAADRAIVDGAFGLAATAIAVATDPAQRARLAR